MALQEVELKDENELEFLLKSDLAQIEKDMGLITTQLRNRDGRIDILAIDVNKKMVIIELKQTSDENQMSQAISYFDWVLENMNWVKKCLSCRSCGCEAKDSIDSKRISKKCNHACEILGCTYFTSFIIQL